MSKTDTSAFTSTTKNVPTQAEAVRPLVCDSIRENRKLHLDEKICCGNDNDCFNVDTRCYQPNRLVKCHEISGIDACERRNRNNSKAENNDAVKEVCKKENLDKYFCISTDSVVNDPSLDGELDWIVNRPFNGINTEFGASCQTCICCNVRECSRISGKHIGCIAGCPINNLTMLNQKCFNIFGEPIENIRVANCSDMFKSGNCQFYNISTGSLIEVEKNSKLFFQPEVCDFTVKSPPLFPPSPSPSSSLVSPDTGDKNLNVITFILTILSVVLTALGVWITWKQYKSKREKKRKKRNGNSEIVGLNNQQSQAHESQNVTSVETENRTEGILNNRRISDQRNEEIEI